jgi:FAD/FMN-containing dehydrogenase
MKGIQFHDESFSPANCGITINGTAMTAGAGTQMLEAYQAVAAINQTVVGGNGRTVALGGFLTGAGHSILAPKHGLAADQVLEMEIVTPTGEILELNECQHTDLFWAMRGVCSSSMNCSTFAELTLIIGRWFNVWSNDLRNHENDPKPFNNEPQLLGRNNS